MAGAYGAQPADGQPAPAAQPIAGAYGAQSAPQPSHAAPSTHAAPAASQPAAPDSTLRTRDAGDSALDRPPRNMLPIYALIGVVVVAAIVVAIVLAMQ